ncbi:hypothetical protein N7486_011270 [Penicillium sp. IBT 16267x]|nr:hypothetical protein N7486_011270 [Penicillium sp. IBT 16267x]
MARIFFLCTIFLQTATALATGHSPNGILRRTLRRTGRPLQHHGPGRKNDPTALVHDAVAQDSIHGSYSSNWAGAVLDTPPPSGATFTYASATITVPTPTALATGNPQYQAASAWVGIDGSSYTTAILQTGVDFYVLNGQSWVDVWYEWYPNFSLDYDELLVSPGDVIVASVNATSASKGICIVENLTTGESATQAVSAPKSTATLAGRSVEWVVEDFSTEGNPVDFVGFGDVQFHGCVAEDSVGGMHGTEGTTIYDLVIDGVVVADADVVDGSTVIVTRL